MAVATSVVTMEAAVVADAGVSGVALVSSTVVDDVDSGTLPNSMGAGAGAIVGLMMDGRCGSCCSLVGSSFNTTTSAAAGSVGS